MELRSQQLPLPSRFHARQHVPRSTIIGTEGISMRGQLAALSGTSCGAGDCLSSPLQVTVGDLRRLHDDSKNRERGCSDS
jgi:hypothetical protein